MTDLEVLHGSPSPAELAAVVIALTPVAVADEAAPGGPQSATPAWTQAALVQGVGGTVARTPADLRRRPA